MSNIRELLDAVKKAKGVETDYALAKVLTLPKQRISDYYKGKTAPDQFACLKIAESLNKPLAEIITAVEIDAEKDESRREAWRKYYKSIGGIAASFVLALFFAVTLIVTPTPAEASIGGIGQSHDLYYVNYARRIKGFILAAISTVRRMLSTSIPHYGFSG